MEGNWSLTQRITEPGVYDVTAGCFEHDVPFTERFSYPSLQFTAFDPSVTTTSSAVAPTTTRAPSTTAVAAKPVDAAPSFTG